MGKKECPKCEHEMELVCPNCGYTQDAMDTIKERENN
jgi:ribosomal protein S27AE